MALRVLKSAGLALGLVAIGGLLLAERAAPLRTRTRAAWPRMARNAAMGVACQAVVMASETPITDGIARRNARQRRGLQHIIGGPAGRIAAFLAMDYGIYLWHVATHKVPVLWRLHRVHHVDPDCDVSTAVRFHAADMLVSLPWRMVQVRVSGIDPAGLRLWRGFFFLSVLFHHSNWRLPRKLERVAERIVTTPRRHGIHHSQDPVEMDSNWSSGLIWWDQLHGTLRDDVPMERLTIGVDDPSALRDEALLPALAAPFRKHGAREDMTQIE